MRVLHAMTALAAPAPSVCCIGTFDGVHLGHQQLIRAAVDDAHARSAQAVVITFFPHPRVVLGRAPSRYLTSQDAKVALMQQLGVDCLLIHSFTRETMQTSADGFMQQVNAAFHLRSLWLGPDFTLGHNRQGNAEYLSALGRRQGFVVNVMPHQTVAGLPVSSSRIREALDRGDVREVETCLGRPYQISAARQADGAWCAGEQAWLPTAGIYRAAIGEGGAITRVCVGSDRCSLTFDGVLPPDSATALSLQFV